MYLIEYHHIYNESYLISSGGDITHVIFTSHLEELLDKC